MHNASQVCNVSRYGLKIAKVSTVQNVRLAPRMGQNAHAVGEKRPDVEKLIIFQKLMLVVICISHTHAFCFTYLHTYSCSNLSI